MLTRTVVTLLLAIAASNGAAADIAAKRVVSLDYCADQFVLKLVPRANILALSPDAYSDFSYMRAAAEGIPQVRPVAEDILTIKPDVVVRLYGGGLQIGRLFERAGISVVQMPYTETIADIREAIRFVATELGVPEKGDAIVAEMDSRLERVSQSATTTSAIYMTPGGVTSGPGTSIHEILTVAGLENFQKLPGWRSIPLERLAHEQPDMVAAAFFDSRVTQHAMWSAMRHPVAKRLVEDKPTVLLEGAWTSCGGWFVLDAIEALAAAGAPDSQP